MSRSVPPARAVILTHRLLIRQLVTRGRVLALLALGTLVMIVSAAVGASDEVDDRLEAGVELMEMLGFTLAVPVVALVFAAAAFGDAREDGTLVYLWLRPMNRWPVVLGAWLAAITVSLPITVVPLAFSAALTRGGGSLVGATVLAAIVGVLAYSAVFLLLGLLLKNSIVWGLGYVLIWEGIVATFGSAANKLAIRGYTRSIITAQTDIDLDLGDVSLAAGVAVPLIVTVAALLMASVRLGRLDVA